MAAFVLGLLLMPLHAAASSSTSYSIQEDTLDGGGLAESGSAGFRLFDSLGASVVGEAASTEFGQQAGLVNTNEPSLTVVVNTPSVNLGALSTSATRTGVATFSVRNYTSYGYIVQLIGSPPSNGGHVLTNMSSAASSQPGSEQFGINLKDNNSPDIGAEAQQVPDNSFSFGAPASGYNAANSFKYVSGDTIAMAAKSSGQTDYTVSYVANISVNTPGGSYATNQTLVVTGTY